MTVQLWRVRLGRNRVDYPLDDTHPFNDRIAVRVWAGTEHQARGMARNRYRDYVVLGKPQPCGKHKRDGSIYEV